MPNTPLLPIFAFGSTVKAWCVTTNHTVASQMTGPQFDDTNFVDGYNLRLDRATQNNPTTGAFSSAATDLYYTGALKFSFVNPLRDNKYKIFVNVYGYGPGTSGSLGVGRFPQVAHALNSSLYPKTQESFWIRVGWFANAASAARPTGSGRAYDNILCNIKLWLGGVSQLGVVVI